MFLTRVSPDRLGNNRLDADYYRPEYLEIESKLKAHNVCRLADCGYFFAGPFGSKLPSDLYLDKGIPLFRVGNVGQFEVLVDTFAHLDKSVHEELKTSEVRPGDLLIVKASVGEKICKVPDWMPKANITQHIIAVRPNGFLDVDYISVFLFSYHGRKQLERYSLGSIIQYLGVNDARSVLTLKAHEIVQKYIGDKVRQAERLRAWAKQLKAKVDAQLNFLQLPLSEKPKMLNVVKASTLENRLDPRPYRTHYLALVAAIKAISNSNVGDIAEFASGCPVSSNDFVEGAGIPLVRIRNIGYEGFSDLDTGVSEAVFSSEPKYQAKTGQIVVGMDGIFRAQFFLEEDLPMFINQRVAILDAEGMRPELLTHWLNRPEGQMQLNQWAVKTTVEHTSLPDIARIRLPRLDDEQENQLADRLLDARVARFLSNRLVTAAKLLVEALIENRITEAQLIAAQHALEAGDTGPDRALLGRLRTDGLDGQGPPLFADLYRLHTLLEQAEAAAV